MKDKPEVKVRKGWGNVKPVTSIFKNKKLYSRRDKFKKPVRENFTGTSSMGTVDQGIMPTQGYRRPDRPNPLQKTKKVKRFKKRMKLKEAIQIMADRLVPSPF